MSSNIAFTLPFTVGGSKNVSNYFDCDSSIEQNTESTWAGPCVLRWTKTNEKFALLNSTGMDELFPNAVAKPISGYMSASIARTGLSGTSTLHGYVGTTKVLECTSKNTTYTLHSANMSAEVISGTSRLTPFMFSGFSSTLVNQMAASSVTISLTFTRYDFAANGVNCSVSVSSSTGYDGDAITFTATPNSACTFLGWYSGSTRLSTSKTYTHTVNGADVTLTARATDPPIRRRYLLWGNEIKLGDEINENFSVTYGSRTLVESYNGIVGYGHPLYSESDTAVTASTDEAKTASVAAEKPSTVTVTLSKLSKGSKGAEVKTVQRILRVYGINSSLAIDGSFGANTEAAVIKLQKKLFPNASSEWDGVVGEKTWSAMLTELK